MLQHFVMVVPTNFKSSPLPHPHSPLSPHAAVEIGTGLAHEGMLYTSVVEIVGEYQQMADKHFDMSARIDKMVKVALDNLGKDLASRHKALVSQVDPLPPLFCSRGWVVIACYRLFCGRHDLCCVAEANARSSVVFTHYHQPYPPLPCYVLVPLCPETLARPDRWRRSTTT